MPTEYLLIDLENVTPDWIPSLLENQIVLIFTGSKQININRNLVVSTQPFGNRIQWIVINGNGKNALDFHIAFYMGIYSEKEPTALFTILSKDTGFDPLIKHLVSKGIKCKRIEDIDNFSKPKVILKHGKNVDKIVSDLKNYFIKCDKKMRPRKYGKFFAFVKSRGNLDDTVVNAVIAAMIADRRIEIHEEQIVYTDDDLPF